MTEPPNKGEIMTQYVFIALYITIGIILGLFLGYDIGYNTGWDESLMYYSQGIIP